MATQRYAPPPQKTSISMGINIWPFSRLNSSCLVSLQNILIGSFPNLYRKLNGDNLLPIICRLYANDTAQSECHVEFWTVNIAVLSDAFSWKIRLACLVRFRPCIFRIHVNAKIQLFKLLYHNR